MINRISWGAVLAGVVVALVAQLILNMIGIGIGASTLDPGAGAAENPSARGFSIGAGVWVLVSGIVAALAGGFAAAQLTSDYASADGIRLPTKRRAYARAPDRRPIGDLLLVSIDIGNVSFE